MERVSADNDNKPYKRGEVVALTGRSLREVESYFKEKPPYIFLCYGDTKATCLVTSRSTWSTESLRRRIPEQIPSRPLELANYDLPPHIYGIATKDISPTRGPRSTDS
ncbi:MAG: hypothetical protein WAX38_01380 [Minisyncoccia bacterium]